jgi:hypothetical protein
MKAAKSRSKAAQREPVVNQPERRHSTTARISCSPMSGNANGTEGAERFSFLPSGLRLVLCISERTPTGPKNFDLQLLRCQFNQLASDERHQTATCRNCLSHANFCVRFKGCSSNALCITARRGVRGCYSSFRLKKAPALKYGRRSNQVNG